MSEQPSEQPPEHTAFTGAEHDDGGPSEPEDADALEDEYHGPDPEEDESGTADDEDQGI